jgi:hypothetical protein
MSGSGTWVELVRGKLENLFPALREWVDTFLPIQTVLQGVQIVVDVLMIAVRAAKFLMDMTLGIILMFLQRVGSALALIAEKLNVFKALSKVLKGVLEGSLAWYTYSGKVRDLGPSFDGMFKAGPPEYPGNPAQAPQATVNALVFAATLSDTIGRLRRFLLPTMSEAGPFRDYAQNERLIAEANRQADEAEDKAYLDAQAAAADRLRERNEARAKRVKEKLERIRQRALAREKEARKRRVEAAAQERVTTWLASLPATPLDHPGPRKPNAFYDSERQAFIDTVLAEDLSVFALERDTAKQELLNAPDDQKAAIQTRIDEAQEAWEIVVRTRAILRDERLSEEQQALLDRVGPAPLTPRRKLTLYGVLQADIAAARAAKQAAEAQTPPDTAKAQRHEQVAAFWERVLDHLSEMPTTDAPPVPQGPGSTVIGLTYQGRVSVAASFEPLLIVSDLLDDAIDFFEILLDFLGAMLDVLVTLREAIERILLKFTSTIAKLERIGAFILRFVSLITGLINQFLDALAIGTLVMYRYGGSAAGFGPATAQFFGAGVPGENNEPDPALPDAIDLLQRRLGEPLDTLTRSRATTLRTELNTELATLQASLRQAESTLKTKEKDRETTNASLTSVTEELASITRELERTDLTAARRSELERLKGQAETRVRELQTRYEELSQDIARYLLDISTAQHDETVLRRAIRHLSVLPAKAETPEEVELAFRLAGYPPNAQASLLRVGESLRTRVAARLQDDIAYMNELETTFTAAAQQVADSSPELYESFWLAAAEAREKAQLYTRTKDLLAATPDPDGAELADPLDQIVHMLILTAENPESGELFTLLTGNTTP